MDREIRDKWIAALRSGKYQQGRCTLRDKQNKFCCLGVLCDITSPEGWKLPKGRKLYYMYNSSGYIRDEHGKFLFLSEGEQNQLTAMNDGLIGKPKTFLEIADWIEANL